MEFSQNPPSSNFDSLSPPQSASLTVPGPPQSRKPTPASASHSSPHLKGFDPQQLLNPKNGTAAYVRSPNDHADDQTEGLGAGSMIEKLNNVTAREDAPAKKRKLQTIDDGEENKDYDGDDRKKAKSSFSNSAGGTISDHMRQERADNAPPAETIDLTNDDDEVQFVKDSVNEEVCLGVLQANANVHRIPPVSAQAQGGMPKTFWPKMKIEMSAGSHNRMSLLDRFKKEFGALDAKVAAGIVPIFNGSNINRARFKTYLVERQKKPDDAVGKSVSQTLKVEIILYAPRGKAEQIGRFLSQKQLFLSTPIANPGKEFLNPQQPTNFGPPKAKLIKTQQSASSVQRSAEQIRREANNMFDSLAKNEDLPEMEANSSIIRSQLMSHQKKALHFLTHHERGEFYDSDEHEQASIWKSQPKPNGRPAWYHIITGQEVFEKPRAIQGGILADVMGLGKTLSILALIAQTREDARRFRNEELPESEDLELNAKTTLIICPKSVLSNWEQQIRTHTMEGKMKVYIYHGASRNQDIDELAKYDVILTSYNTAASEFGDKHRKKNALNSINWFRIVLDEAHSIRTQTTKIFKACCALSAQRRWAVTGTPVQNTLLDLGALIQFVRLKPFDEPQTWSQYIMAPFKMGDVEAIPRLQILVGSITLRRMKSTIGLPDREEVRERLNFSKKEMALYRQFATKSRSQFHNITGGGTALKGKAYAHVLKSLGRLRAICAHGKEMLTEEDLKEVEGDDPDNAIVLDLGDEPGEDSGEEFFTEKQAYEYLATMQDSEVDVCQSCSEKLGSIDLTDDDDDDDDDGNAGNSSNTEDEDSQDDDGAVSAHRADLLCHLTPCLHLICTRCTKRHEAECKATLAVDGFCECPHCEQWQRYGMFPLYRSGSEKFREARRNQSAKRATTARWDENTYSGPHTKVKALIDDIKQSQQETLMLTDGEPPIRSVVFSGWTAYLDLIEYAFGKENIGFTRIDGSMSVKERSQALQVFNTVPDVIVLLVSIKAGGQGLNFTAANKAYVMEPQFNPGVEAQAVDRIHRIGQTRPVSIKHYIMNESVEEGILKLQQKKEQLAKLSMEKQRSKSEEAKQRMQELKELFK